MLSAKKIIKGVFLEMSFVLIFVVMLFVMNLVLSR
ncbi:hypothetical protein EDD71_11420 [Fonticella tunisiensis]|uniref:Uncharacterized protein n=1 Tax=Fonticella tunisiensis TaxID=1096341 RepID=A0A4V3ES40_9CLOT|nr:hypothetical protein EDD71_11420 [Fonticella tunisiensis]